ncbi:MAG TPA: FHA domain-containing protein [Methanolinea sp.]|nr:FHA domain-containing protein [Methanolinea sp.]
MAEGQGTILTADDAEFLEELSEYLEILGNSTRLRILRLLEKNPLDARSVSIATGISYENTKKHLERLLHAGLITRSPGLGRETSRGVHPVWEYSHVPDVIRRVQRDLGFLFALPPHAGWSGLHGQVSTVRQRLSLEWGTLEKLLLVMGGEWDCRTLPLASPCTALGRVEPGVDASLPRCGCISFPESYRSLTRISRPHALITERDGRCVLEDRGSTGGTYLNGKRIAERQQVLLRDGDRISLSLGEFGATLLFLHKPDQDTGEPGAGM